MSPAFRRVLLFVALAGTSCSVREETRLTEGQVQTRSSDIGESDVYLASLDRGEVLHLRVEQRGLDVEVVLPDELRPVDLLLGAHVTEEVWRLADEPEELRIEVQAVSGVGDYRLTVEKMGPADETDRQRAEAFRLVRVGMSEEALAPLEAALDLWHDTGPQVREALTWHELGELRLNLGNASEAVAAYDKAIALLTPLPEPLLRGWMLYQRGRAQKQAWRLDEAAADYREAGEVFAQLDDVGGQASVANGQAVLSYIWGDLEVACAGYERAGELYRQAGNAGRLETVQLNLGRCWMKLGAMEKTLPILEEALRLARSDKSRASDLREIGWWYALEHRPREALLYLRQAREIREDAAVLDRLGTVYRNLGNFSEARELYLTALKKTNDIVERGHSLVNLCSVEEMTGHVDEGLERCREALAIFEEIRASGTLAVIHELLARLLRRQARLGEAEAHAREALRQLESQRILLEETDSRLVFLSERQDAYRLLVDLCMDLHAKDPDADWDARALEASELTRARGLVDLLSAEKVDPGRVDPVLLATEQRLEKSRQELVERVKEERTTAAGVGRELSELEEQLATVRRRLRETAPSYMSLTRPWLPAAQEIQALLDDETLLLVYHVGDSGSYLWRVRHEDVEGARLPEGRDVVERLADSWYDSLADSTLGWTEGDIERRRAERLSRVLLVPATEIARCRRLVVVADGVLQRLPFGALPSPVDGEERAPLIAFREVVTLPSASVLSILRRQSTERASGDGLLAVVADAVYASDDERLSSSTRREGETGLRRLRGSAGEAEDLLKLAAAGPVRLLDGFAARRDQVLGGALAGFRIVHFATHARTKSASGRPLGLVLSLFDEEGRPLDGILGLDELYHLELPADLAVLSACGTVLGEDVAGEGLVGLTRGFMHAGTPRVVVSLWDLRDSAARESMHRFYQALLDEGAAPGEALRRAQASMWHDGWAVRDWAAFVLQGDWRPFPVAGR